MSSIPSHRFEPRVFTSTRVCTRYRTSVHNRAGATQRRAWRKPVTWGSGRRILIHRSIGRSFLPLCEIIIRVGWLRCPREMGSLMFSFSVLDEVITSILWLFLVLKKGFDKGILYMKWCSFVFEREWKSDQDNDLVKLQWDRLRNCVIINLWMNICVRVRKWTKWGISKYIVFVVLLDF